MYLSNLDVQKTNFQVLEEIIFPIVSSTEQIPFCQAALVLGTSHPNIDRTPEAVKQYKSGNCGKLVMSGGVYWDTEYGRLTEAEYMQRYAMDNGVPEKDIVLDNMARTTIENMLCGAIAMHREFNYISEVKDLMLITSLYHMRRSMLIAEELLPKRMRVHPCPAFGIIDKSNWKNSESGINRVKAEVGYIKAMIVNGMTDDIKL